MLLFLMKKINLLFFLVFISCKNDIKLIEGGQKLYISHACNVCHSLDGSRMIGPSFKNIYNKEIKFNDGTKRFADDSYLIESILEPSLKIVEGYPNLMGSYRNILSQSEIDSLVKFIKEQTTYER